MMEHKQTLISQIILGAIERAPRNFDNLIELCHSLFPDELQTVLDGMVSDMLIGKMDDEYTLNSSSLKRWTKIQIDWQENLDRSHKALIDIMDRIHLPHCLDYEWWFTHTSREDLSYRIVNQNPLPVPHTIAFLGSPLLGAFLSLLVPETEIYILDKSKATLDTISKSLNLRRLHLVHYDAENPLPNDLIGIAQMVFFDPPWYEDYYKLFLRRSMQLSYGNYSMIAIVLFPILTRPTSLQERKRVLETAMSYGLSVVDIEPRVAHYLTPRFEYESLNKKGISVKNWRKGDLVLFLSDGGCLPENIAIRVEQFQWKEAIIGKVKVKVKIKEENPNIYIAPVILTAHGSEAILSSVSRRDPFRNEVDLWTSTHRGLKIKGWKAVWKIVEGMQDCVTTTEEMVTRIKDFYIEVDIPDSVYEDVEKVWTQLRGHILER